MNEKLPLKKVYEIDKKSHSEYRLNSMTGYRIKKVKFRLKEIDFIVKRKFIFIQN
jgi:hypothetical protein